MEDSKTYLITFFIGESVEDGRIIEGLQVNLCKSFLRLVRRGREARLTMRFELKVESDRRISFVGRSSQTERSLMKNGGLG